MRMLKLAFGKGPSSGRECGDCQECCYHFGIKETDSPPMSQCQHQCETGCNIYASRPDRCREYECMWLQGFLGDDKRPDICGAMVSKCTQAELTIDERLGIEIDDSTLCVSIIGDHWSVPASQIQEAAEFLGCSSVIVEMQHLHQSKVVRFGAM